MNNDPLDTRGLPDAGGVNIDYRDTGTFEPTEEQLEMIQTDVEAIADRVRSHLTKDFIVTTRLSRTQDEIQGHVVVEFPSGDAIAPGIPVTADMFDGADRPDWNGPIPSDEIETMGREITMVTVTQWAKLLEHAGDARARPAS